ncbi:zinc ABC transporter substrate-binding protein [Thiosulfativibrio zosterae]|uniref:High-affinity zinc uptake system protein ZnuA n=1 Tax=Thiosulfativibrio zosterae TaxID=2675053 RepID=A0A6F8PLE6_9GAMM|nr:zinc ABC transporter substrate-binding protein [Thiosulfativibrio zosterae]BBP42922.1 zinc ABC transporter substrate-binding protein [Thiosulfativibrio zosterae]
MLPVIQLLSGLSLSIFSVSVWALTIVATIPPVGSLALPFMSDKDQLSVILTTGQSPHGFQMRPSHRLQLEQADLILAVGTGVDAWSEKVLKTMPEKVIWMQKQPGLVKFSQRNDEKWPKHSHPSNAAAEHHEAGHEEHEHKHEHEHEQSTADYYQDPHIWLSPKNGELMGSAIANRLMTLEPQRTLDIQQKLVAWQESMAALDKKIAQQLAAVKSQPFLVLHDAFQYFEKHYQLYGVGAIQVNPELKPSLKKVLALRAQIQKDGVVCVFKEPQFPEKQVTYLIEGLAVHMGQLDPLGRQAQLQPYAQLLQGLADSFSECLQKGSGSSQGK